MEDQLLKYGFPIDEIKSSVRVRGVHTKELYIPPSLENPVLCASMSNETILGLIQSRAISSLVSSGNDFKSLPTALCGRKKNSKHELAVTMSHLKAIRNSIYSKSTKPYALILEDDVRFAFDINFKKLISSAPKEFGMLQLITSNDYGLLEMWEKYRDLKQIWSLRRGMY
jgi:hypothetical protein